jgi:hypothetical protein
MKIENIIDDIIDDTTEIRNKLEEKVKKEYPHLNIAIALPGLKDLSAIKEIEITITEENTTSRFSVDLHTHNGHRVFEHNSLNDNQNIGAQRHPLQDPLVNLLREIIKKRKSRRASFQRSTSSMM